MSITLAFGYRLRHFSSRAPRRQKAGAWLPLEGSLRLRSSGRVGDGRAVSVCALRWYVHIAVRRVMSASPTNSHGSRPRASIYTEGAQTLRRDRQPCGPRGVEGRGGAWDADAAAASSLGSLHWSTGSLPARHHARGVFGRMPESKQAGFPARDSHA